MDVGVRVGVFVGWLVFADVVCVTLFVREGVTVNV